MRNILGLSKFIFYYSLFACIFIIIRATMYFPFILVLNCFALLVTIYVLSSGLCFEFGYFGGLISGFIGLDCDTTVIGFEFDMMA